MNSGTGIRRRGASSPIDDPKVARLAAELHLERGAHEDGILAIQHLQICFQADPRDLSILRMLAEAFDIVGHGDKAVQVLKEAARLARRQGDSELFDEIVDLLTRRAPDDEVVQELDGLRRVSFDIAGKRFESGALRLDDEVTTVSTPSERARATSLRAVLDEDDVWHIEQLTHEGRFDEARELLGSLVGIHGRHPLLLELALQLEGEAKPKAVAL